MTACPPARPSLCQFVSIRFLISFVSHPQVNQLGSQAFKPTTSHSKMVVYIFVGCYNQGSVGGDSGKEGSPENDADGSGGSATARASADDDWSRGGNSSSTSGGPGTDPGVRLPPTCHTTPCAPGSTSACVNTTAPSRSGGPCCWTRHEHCTEGGWRGHEGGGVKDVCVQPLFL